MTDSGKDVMSRQNQELNEVDLAKFEINATISQEEKNIPRDRRTGLPFYTQELRGELNQAMMIIPENETVAVIYMDMEGLKKLNEKYGDPIGDKGINAQTTRALEIAKSYRGETPKLRMIFLTKKEGTRSDELFFIVFGQKNEIENITMELNGDYEIEGPNKKIIIHSNAALACQDDIKEVARSKTWPLQDLEIRANSRIIDLKVQRKFLQLEKIAEKLGGMTIEEFNEVAVDLFAYVGMAPEVLGKLLELHEKLVKMNYMGLTPFKDYLEHMRSSLN